MIAMFSCMALSLKPVEDQSCRRHGRGGEEIRRRLVAHVQHAEQHGPKSARGVGQGQKVSQVKLTDHREVFRRRSSHGVKIYK